MTDLRVAWFALRELGPKAVFHYSTYRLGLATGWVRRKTPGTEWSEVPLAKWLRPEVPSAPDRYAVYRGRPDRPRFFFDGEKPGLPWEVRGEIPHDLRTEADDLLGGRFRLFGGVPLNLGRPPDWLSFPAPLSATPPITWTAHWTEIPLDATGADLRLLWEPSRFGWLFTLGRAFRWTGDGRYADAAWQLVESWREANPPNRGVHWASGQEVAIRILALAFAAEVFAPAWRGSAERVAALGQMIAVHAARLPPTLSYARAQANNHLLSEGAGLLTAGILYPEFAESRRWKQLGRAVLQDGFATQVFDDGGYIQHSANYHRLALSLGVWAVRLAEINGEALSRRTLEALGRLTRGLAAQMDPETGETAVFGPDDGSNLLPLASVGARDARPVAAAGARLLLAESWYPAGAWDEASLWLGLGSGAGGEPASPATLPQAGIHFLRGRQTRAALRCARFRGRPGDSDQLHVDLWWGSEAVAIDPGSYLYNGPPPWQNALAAAAVHNAPCLDGQEPMRRAGRFLWVDRAQGRITGRFQRDGLEAIRAEHDGYRRIGAAVVRCLALVDGAAWLVVDEARAARACRMTVGWNLPDGRWTLGLGAFHLTLPQGDLLVEWKGKRATYGLARAGEWIAGETVHGPIANWGWQSPCYATLEPCLRLVVEVKGEGSTLLATRFLLGDRRPASMDSLWADPAGLDRLFTAAAPGR